jgi:ArsR family transcriptional regulator
MKPRNDAEPKPEVSCRHEHDHGNGRINPVPDTHALERAARLFRALGDAPRLRILLLLMRGEVCVGELVTALGEKFSTVSQRLRVLRTEGLVSRRRDGSHVYYGLSDDHVKGLVANAVAHADELDGSDSQPPETEDER